VVLTIPAAYIQNSGTYAQTMGLLQKKLEEHLSDSGPLAPIMEFVSATPGKRLRPLLTILSSTMAGETFGTTPDQDTVFDVAAAIELIHMASLVHDDIIDDAKRRRGMPTVHVVWGLHSAVLAGDYLFTRANRIALRYPELGIASLFNQAIELTCEGEIMQDERLYDASVTEKEYLSHISRKTAVLMGAACQAGAMLANAPPHAEEALLRFGIELGCAFQIADDVLDFTADPEESGKEACNDLRRGLLTLPTILAMETPIGDLVRKAFQARSVDADTVSEIRAGLILGGHIQKAKQNAAHLARKAASRLSIFSKSASKDALEGIAGEIVNRMADKAV